jgi:hypothetical protein
MGLGAASGGATGLGTNNGDEAGLGAAIGLETGLGAGATGVGVMLKNTAESFVASVAPFAR